MSCTVVIREYKPSDNLYVTEVVRDAYLSNVFDAWCNMLVREITFQMIVMSAAVLFIFVGVPLLYCIVAIPIVLIVMYMAIYSAHLLKSLELMQSKRPLQCWVAEVHEPLIVSNKSALVTCRIIFADVDFNEINCKKMVIGTVAVSGHARQENTAWLFRLAVNRSYQRKGIGRALVHVVLKWCCMRRYGRVEVALSECQETSRQLFVDKGFEMKQLYHKQLLGNLLTLLMYQLSCDLNSIKPDL